MSEPVANTKCRDSYPDIASCWRCLKRGREAVAVKAQVQQPVVQEDHRPERQQLPPQGWQEGAEQTTHHPLKFPGRRSQRCHSAIYWSWSRARRGCSQSCKPSTLAGWLQWRRKIVEFRGAEARRHAELPYACFSLANIELFTATNSPDDSLLLSWVQIHFHRTAPTNYELHFFQSYTCLLVWHVKNDATLLCYLWSNYSTNRVKLFKIMVG